MKAYKDDNDMSNLNIRTTILETLAQQIQQTLSRLENKIDKLDDKLEFHRSENRKETNELRKENTSQFRATMFTLLTLIGTPLLLESIKLLTKFLAG